ncbi:hypothetical protein [Trichocoleus sp. FACHB-69]|uniref:hypothetical protein n=1 Tax=Cyanophyceae TaxID=3028117 RepID=UPI0018EFB86C|nr:hypothetical protein [Trichocoleus sp. FACHB-69]
MGQLLLAIIFSPLLYKGDLVAATLGHSSVTVTGRYLHARPEESSSLYLLG